MKQDFLDSWIIQKSKYIITNPISFCLITGFNFYFYFKEFGVSTNLLILYVWSAITCGILVLAKYKIIKVDTIIKRHKIWITSGIIFIILGVGIGVYLLFIQLLISLASLIINVFGPRLGIKIFVIGILLLIMILWPIKGLINQEIRLTEWNIKVKGKMAIAISILLILLLLLTIATVALF